MDFIFCRLGGNPCCNNSALETLYYAQLNCRYNSFGVLIVNRGHILEHNNLLVYDKFNIDCKMSLEIV